MEKREQVFVSSTYIDLAEARDKVFFSLLEADCFPAGMELFPASNASQWELIKTIIDDSDYYLLIIAGRYGSIDETDGKSYTEKEFDYAVETGKPIVVFAHNSPESLPGTATDQDDHKRGKLKEFRDKACTGRTVKFWTQKEELAGMVAMALNHLRKFDSAVGWVRGDQAMTAEKQSELIELRARLHELEHEAESQVPFFPDLADGEDAIEFTVTFVEITDEQGSYTQSQKTIRLTWNEVLYGLGPTILSPTPTGRFDEAFDATVRYAFPPGQYEDTYKIPSFVYDTVRMHLFASALISREEAATGWDRWKLTRRGSDRLFALRAIRTPGITVLKSVPEPRLRAVANDR